MPSVGHEMTYKIVEGQIESNLGGICLCGGFLWIY
jgi:hypothetical protein